MTPHIYVSIYFMQKKYYHLKFLIKYRRALYITCNGKEMHTGCACHDFINEVTLNF